MTAPVIAKVRRIGDADALLLDAAKALIIARTPSRPSDALGGYAVVIQGVVRLWSIAGNTWQWQPRAFDYARSPAASSFIMRKLGVDRATAQNIDGSPGQVLVATIEPELAKSGLDFVQPPRVVLRKLATYTVRKTAAGIIVS